MAATSFSYLLLFSVLFSTYVSSYLSFTSTSTCLSTIRVHFHLSVVSDHPLCISSGLCSFLDFSSEIQPLKAFLRPPAHPSTASQSFLCSVADSLLHKSENPVSFAWIEQERLEALKGFEDFLVPGKVAALHHNKLN